MMGYVPDVCSTYQSPFLRLSASERIALLPGYDIRSLADGISFHSQKRGERVKTIHFRYTHVSIIEIWF